jgi:WD40 repeat protein
MVRYELVAASAIVWLSAELSAQPAFPADGFPLPTGAIHRFGNRQARHPEPISASAVSPDGKYLATLSTSCVVVWDAKTMSAKCVLRGSLFGGYGVGDRNASLAFFPDSKSLLVPIRPTDRTSINVDAVVELAQVWDLDGAKIKFGIKGGWSWISAAWLVNGGKEIAMQSYFRQDATIRYFDAKDGKELRTVRTPLMNRGGWVAPLGNRLAIAGAAREGMAVIDAAAGTEIYSISGGKLIQAAISPDGKKLLYHDDSGKVHLHDVDAKKELFTFDHPAEKQRGPMLFSKDLQTLYFGGQFGQLFRWDLKNNKRLPDIGKHSSWTLSTIALSPDESILYSMGGDRLIRRWDLHAGKQLPLPDGYITQTAIVPTTDGKNLIVADHVGRIDFWDLATGKHLKQLQPGNTGGINCVAVSNDGRWFAGGRTLQDAQMWDLSASKLVKTFGLVDKPDPAGSDHVQRVFFRPDGKMLYTTSGKTGITAWSVPDAKKLWQVDNIGPHAACDPNGRWIAIGGGLNNQQVTWTMLDAGTGQVVRRIEVIADEAEDPNVVPYPPYLTDVAFTSDGSRVITSHYGSAFRIWDAQTGKVVGKFGNGPLGQQSIACSPDGRWVAVGRADRKISIWELATAKEVLTLSGHDSAVRDVAFTRDGRGIIGNADMSPVLWSLDPRDPAEAEGSPDRHWQTLASEDGAKAYRLVWALSKDSKAAVKLLSERIDPKNLAIGREQFDKWVTALDSPQFRVREAAERGLMQAGLKVPIEWLRKALADAKGDEPRARLNRVLDQREKPDPNEWRLGRAVQILALAATNEARALLKTWAEAGGSTLANDAKAALERMR